MGLFSALGELVGEIAVSPFTITKGIIDGVEKGIDDIME